MILRGNVFTVAWPHDEWSNHQLLKGGKMKKRLFLASVLTSLLVAGTVSAQTGHEAMHGATQGTEQSSAAPQAVTPMAPGMMMGQGMMHGQMDGQSSMMGGMGKCGSMGGSMMGGMGGAMMGSGMMGNLSSEAQQKYLDATRELRKKLNEKQFEYAEANRNPKADKKELLKKRKELWDLQYKIHEKAWDFMTE